MEYGLYIAKTASLRTLDLSRQVGAAIFSERGEVIALGANEVPRAGGGTYWCDDPEDDRDHKRRIDSNENRKRELLREVLSIAAPGVEPDALMRDPRIRESQFMDALEYGRIIHAEMSAITDAARNGRPLKGATLYCTTFPCHMCAKHIVAAGISKVIFLEPYPKSLASDLHGDSIEIEGQTRGDYATFPSVVFKHFHGASPKRYRDLFERRKRKDRDAKFIEWATGTPKPVMNIRLFPTYIALEPRIRVDVLHNMLIARGLSPEESQEILMLKTED